VQGDSEITKGRVLKFMNKGRNALQEENFPRQQVVSDADRLSASGRGLANCFRGKN